MDRPSPRSTALLALVVFTACGGTTGPPPPKADSGPTPDALPSADARPANLCTEIETSYGDLDTLVGTAHYAPADEDEPDGPQVLTVVIPLNEDPTPDVLFIEMWETEEPFLSQGFTPLTASLGGDQADLITCGACVFIAENYSEGEAIAHNMAYGGEFVLTAIPDGKGAMTVEGSLSDVTMRAVTVSDAGQETVEDGCRSEITALQFQGILTPQD